MNHDVLQNTLLAGGASREESVGESIIADALNEEECISLLATTEG